MKVFRPEIVEMPPQKVATVTSKGDPNAASGVIGALYGAVYTHKFHLKKRGLAPFKVQALRARWPDAHLLPKDQWTGVWALPIPEDTTELPQKAPGVEVKIKTWEYGTVAQVLHIGPYSEEGPTFAALHQFIRDNGYQIAGCHEEEYLTSPRARVMKTIIRYPVKPAAHGLAQE